MSCAAVNNKRNIRRLVGVLASLALVAGACGSDDDAADDEASDSASAPVETEAEAEDEPEPEEEPDDEAEPAETEPEAEEPEPEEEPDDGADGPTVTVTDVIGEKEVPVTDEGIYSLDELMGTILLTLGVEPVTTAAFFQDPLLAPVLDDNSDLVEYGSIESIAATRPDLLLGIGHPNFIEIVDELSGVAPLVLPDFTSTWQEQSRLVAQVVDRVDDAEALIATVEGRIDALAAEIEEAGFAGQQAAIVQDFSGDWFAYGPTTISGAVLEAVGFTRSEAQSGTENFGFIPLAEELIPDETNVPWVFGIAQTSPDGQVLGSIVDNPIVGGADTTVTDVGEAWFNNSVLGAWIVMDDLEAILFGRGEVTGLDGAASAFEALLAAVAANGDAAAADDSAGDAGDAGDEGESAGGGNVVDVGAANGASTITTFASFAPGFNAAVTGPGPV
ncbi:MAG: ABC transporter substrate-binding protein, partial [Actinomycetota bacterium]